MDKDFYNYLLDEERRLLSNPAVKAYENILQLKKYYEESHGKPKNVVSATIKTKEINSKEFEGYSKDWKMKSKVIFILRFLKNASATKVADEIINIDGSMEPKKVMRTVTTYLSDMYKSGEIGAKKEGKKNIYYLNG